MRASVGFLISIILLGMPSVVAIAQTSEPTTGPTTEPSTNPTTFPSTEPATQPTTLATTEPSTNPTTGPSTAPTTNPTTQPTTEPTTLPAAQPPSPPPVALAGTVEGTFFPEEEGKLRRDKDGRQIEFVFDRDGKTMQVPLLPNLELMRLENAVEEGGWDLRFRASGWVTEYNGKNYILLDHTSRVDQSNLPDSSRQVR